MESVGGQAVVDGVMMRSQHRVATAVRILKDGRIKVRVQNLKRPARLFRIPLIRGIYILIDSLRKGIRALIWSSNQNLEEAEKIKTGEMVITMFFSVIVALILFLGVPFLITRYVFGQGILFSLMEGLIRVGLFLTYLGIISFSKEVKKLFQYHGAEHKVINCHEAGEKLTVENVKKYPTLHSRCGTSFIFIVLIISIVVFSFLGVSWTRVLWKLAFIPVIAGISYEILKMSARFKKNLLLRLLVWPGLMLQKITTREPTRLQIEVAIAAFEKASQESR